MIGGRDAPKLAMTKWLVMAAMLGVAFVVVPPIAQDPAYHVFADRRTFLGVANFWNVLSNLPFALVALYGMKAAGQTQAYRWLLAGTAGVAFGSSYYHLYPTDATLFWDRLPMTVVFMSVVAISTGKRLLLFPLLTLGIASVLIWRFTGDLRLYALVQFGSIAAVLWMLVTRRTDSLQSRTLRWVVLLYIAAKALESAGAHPWKHVLAAAALFVYVHAVVRHDRNMTLGGRKTHAAEIELGSLP